jgi:hypothetical protein
MGEDVELGVGGGHELAVIPDDSWKLIKRHSHGISSSRFREVRCTLVMIPLLLRRSASLGMYSLGMFSR